MQVLSYEIYEIFKNIFFTEHLYSGGYFWQETVWKHSLNVCAAEKEMIYLNGTLKVSVSR